MPCITSIEPQMRRKQRRSIFVDDEFFCSVDQEVIVKLRLKPGQTVDTASLRQIVEQEEEVRVREQCLRWLEVRARSRQELATRLARQGVEANLVDRVLDRLQASGLIDDEAFARMYIQTRLRNGGYGQQRLKTELSRRGVKHELIERLIAQEILDEDVACEAVAVRRSRIYQGLPRSTARRRLTAFLGRRGFLPETIYRALNKVLPE